MNLFAPLFSRNSRLLRAKLGIAAFAFLVCAAAQAQPGIYTCKDKFGRTITSDRPIIECAEAGQRILNADGSTKSVILTPEQERRMRKEREERDAEADKITERRRRERNLIQRYPNEAVWERNAYETMIEPFKTIDAAQKRQIEFNKVAEQQKEEAEFYKTSKMPGLLRRQIEENRYAIEAENRLIENKRGEIKVIQARLTAELIELRRLWADRGR
jgi:excinuclease UvrABC ATPase subunit